MSSTTTANVSSVPGPIKTNAAYSRANGSGTGSFVIRCVVYVVIFAVLVLSVLNMLWGSTDAANFTKDDQDHYNMSRDRLIAGLSGVALLLLGPGEYLMNSF